MYMYGGTRVFKCPCMCVCACVYALVCVKAPCVCSGTRVCVFRHPCMCVQTSVYVCSGIRVCVFRHLCSVFRHPCRCVQAPPPISSTSQSGEGKNAFAWTSHGCWGSKCRPSCLYSKLFPNGVIAHALFLNKFLIFKGSRII